MTTDVHASAELEHPIGKTGRFVLRLPAGTVAIHGTDGETARVRDMTGRALGDRFDIATGDGSLEVAARQRFGLTIEIGKRSFGAGPAPDLAIDLPRGASISVDTASADVLAHGLAGPKHFRTASGDLTLESIVGELDLEAVSGDTLVVADGQLDVKAHSISGDFKLRAPKLGRFEMDTTSGDMTIDAEMAGSGPYAIRSISGDVTIVARAGIQVEAQTITGDLGSSIAHRTESSPGKKLLIIGRPVATLVFKSVSGDLEIVEARDRAPISESVAQPAAPAPVTPVAPVRPVAPAVPAPPATPASATTVASADAARLGILEALERGELSIDDASRQLAALEEG